MRENGYAPHARRAPHRDFPAAAAGENAQRLVYEREKRSALDGFDDEIERVHGIAAYGVLPHVRHENEQDERIDGAQLFRRAHAVEVGHLYVHEHNVAVRLIRVEKAQGVVVICGRPVLAAGGKI